MSKQSKIHETGEWPDVTLKGEQHRALSYEREDGMRMVHFTRPDISVRTRDILSRDSSRVVFRVFDAEALLLGLSVALEYRGQGTGQTLVHYFIDNVEHFGDAVFTGTGLIHKPNVALCLNRTGLQPDSDAFLAEILPIPASEKSLVPKIHVVKNEIDPALAIDHADSGKFYEVVNPDEVVRRYPINASGRTVALHTSYNI